MEEIPEMVERVARALARSAGCRMLTEGQSIAPREFGWDINHRYTEKYVEAHWKEHVNAAHFAIEAMREPTTAMKIAAHGVPPIVAKVGGAKVNKLLNFKAQWSAAIDAALSTPLASEGGTK